MAKLFCKWNYRFKKASVSEKYQNDLGFEIKEYLATFFGTIRGLCRWKKCEITHDDIVKMKQSLTSEYSLILIRRMYLFGGNIYDFLFDFMCTSGNITMNILHLLNELAVFKMELLNYHKGIALDLLYRYKRI